MAVSTRVLLPSVLALSLASFALVSCAPEEQREASAVTSAPADSEMPGEDSVADAAPADDDGEGDSTSADAMLENPGLNQETLDARLRSAAWAGDLDDARRLILWGANVNAKDDTEQSAFLVATSEGMTELAQLTLDNGADVNALDSWNGTGLIRAAERGHWEVSGLLIQNGVEIHHVNRVGYQAIHEAVWFGRDDPMYHAALRVLVAGGADLTTPSVNEGLTPLQMAYSKGYPGQAAILEALSGEVPADPESALLEAAESGDANAAALALRAGAAPDSVADDGRTALDIAQESGHSATAMVLRALGG